MIHLELNIWDESFIIRSGPDTFKGEGGASQICFGDLICVCGGWGRGRGRRSEINNPWSRGDIYF